MTTVLHILVQSGARVSLKLALLSAIQSEVLPTTKGPVLSDCTVAVGGDVELTAGLLGLLVALDCRCFHASRCTQVLVAVAQI